MTTVHFENIRKYLLSELDHANSKIIIAVYWFTNDDLFQKLISKLIDTVEVELIIHNDYINNRDTGLPFQQFIDNGGKFYFSNSNNPMHNKFCVIDDKILINGSYNWTYYAEDRNRENILILKNEPDVTRAFTLEFEKLKLLTEKVENIRLLTRFEVDESNLLRARDYLANDLVHKAKESGVITIVENAFQIAPDNIDVQKLAFNLNLTKKYKLNYSIGSSLRFDKYLIIVPKGTYLPVSKSEVVQTSVDNQTSSLATIHYGENLQASKNSKITQMFLNKIPKKPAGEAKIKYHFTIDIYGNLKMEKFSLDNGVREVIHKNIMNLFSEEK